MSRRERERTHVSVSGAAYEALQARARAEGRSVSALVEELVADLPDVPEPSVVHVDAGLYRQIGAVARRQHRTFSAVLEAALLRALADAESFPPRPRRSCKRPMVAHASRSRTAVAS